MSGYNRIGIGELQQRILRHFFECQDQVPESVNHIANSLGVVQPAVFMMCKLLIEEVGHCQGSRIQEWKKGFSCN